MMVRVWKRDARYGIAAGLLAALTLTAACGGDKDVDALAGNVDESTPVALTDAEIAAFRSPADSVLTPQQIEAFLKTSLLQFDLMRKHSETWHARAKEIDERAQKGGALSALRNVAATGSLFYQFANTVAGSYIRSARTLGYNPAEMEWVRERMLEVAGYVALKPMHEMAVQNAQELRTYAEEMRAKVRAGEFGDAFSEADIEEMLRSADAAQQDFAPEASGAVLRNAELLRRVKPGVSEQMWASIGIVGGTMGLGALTGLTDPNDLEAQRQLDEFRGMFEDALNNRTSPGMEPSTAKRSDE
jgi:hypothetical protein